MSGRRTREGEHDVPQVSAARDAWDRIAESEDRWFRAVSAEEIESARKQQWRLKLTPTRDIPAAWWGPLAGRDVLCLAAAGGQQAPLLAAAGARVTVVDFSERQLARDRRLADTHGLPLTTLQLDMRDLGPIEDAAFEVVVNPTSVVYAPAVEPIWNEVSRVLRPGGVLIAGMMLPEQFVFDPFQRDRGQLQVKQAIPYSDHDLPPADLEKLISPERPVEYGHSMTELLGTLVDTGMRITHLLTDRWGGRDPVSRLLDTFVAIRAEKPLERLV